jgi:hypothetical protein
MTTTEFSREFDIRFNFVNSNLAMSVNGYEKSVYLTRAQEEILSNYFNAKGNKYGEGFDMSAKRHIDFSSITDTKDITTVKSGYTAFMNNGLVFEILDDILYVLNEKFNYTKSDDTTIKTSVFPLEYSVAQRIMSKPYQSPPRRQSWRIVRGNVTGGHLVVEIIPKADIDDTKAFTYSVRYIKRPTPIVVETLTGGLSVNGVTAITECVLPAEIHDEVLARAIELTRADYLGDANLITQLNQRNE